MRLAFGAGLCRFGMFKATRANVNLDRESADSEAVMSKVE